MFKFSRILVVYAIAVPLALIFGYLVVFSGTFTFLSLAILLGLFALPFFFKWHYFLMLIFWNASFVAFFLPGRPDLWIVFAAISFVISFLNHIMFQKRFLRAPELTYPLLIFAAIVLFTAFYRGGLNIRALGGGSAGGRYYIYVMLAIVGYFAFTAHRIPIDKGKKYVTWFFGSGLCGALSNIALIVGITSPYVYVFLPNQFAVSEVINQAGAPKISRFTGLAPSALSGLCVLIARYGLKGILDGRKPWRAALAFCLVGLSLFGGFRSIVAFTVLLICFQFYFERLLQTRFFLNGIVLVICALIPVFFFSRSMPAPIQRAISFLPVNIDPEIRSDANVSTEWRLDMWAEVIKELPKYLIIGKGYGMDPSEVMAINDAAATGTPTTASPFDTFILSGDYHNGPLSVLMPFGLFGFLTFLWILFSCHRILLWNYRYGDAKLRLVNTFLLSYFMTFTLGFFAIFGALNSQFVTFLGLCGLSISLNGGVKRKQSISPKPVITPAKTLVLSQT